MKASDIKFRKERIDKWTVRHWYDAGTKYLGPVYATKHYTYDIYDADGKLLNYSKYSNVRTLADVKEWIANYDAEMDASKAEEAAEEAARLAEWEAFNAKIEKYNAEAVKPATVELGFKAGDMVPVVIPSINKCSTIGECLAEIESRSRNCLAKVVKIVTLDDGEFDKFAVNLMDNYDFWLIGDEGGPEGGSRSDDPRLEGKDLYSDSSTMDIYRETAYELVHVVKSANRKPIVVNTEGFKYCRYAGVLA